jgi:hypothetical protein
MTVRSSAASKATAALLCVVAFGALVLAFVGLPTSAAVAQPVNLDLDFGTLLPGIPQTQTSSLDVPVASTVRQAHAASTSGAEDVDVTFELCRAASCRQLTAGERIEAGLYTLKVSATLSPDIAPGTTTTIAGQLQLAETKSSGLPQPNTLIAVAGIGIVGVIVAALATRLRARNQRGATS